MIQDLFHLIQKALLNLLMIWQQCIVLLIMAEGGLIYGEDSFRKLTEQELEEENSAICVEETTDNLVEESGMTQSM